VLDFESLASLWSFMARFEKNLDTSPPVSPLVAGVSKRLLQYIQNSEIPSGGSLPSERHLALEFSVSRATIRSAIQTLSSEGFLEAKANCKPVVKTHTAPKLGGSRHIGIWLWPNTADYASASILKGIQRSELDSSVRLIVASAPTGDWESVLAAERRFLETIADDPVEACAIVWYLGGERNLDALQDLRRSGVPIVFVDRLPPKAFPADFVGTNNVRAAEQAVEHLTDLGHRQIALITNIESVSSVAERERGYRRAVKAIGIELDPELIQRVSVDEQIGIQTAIHRLFAGANQPTAIFCVNDLLALHVSEELDRRRIRVPDDVSVVGFDGLMRWLPGGGNLTSACQNFQQIGEIAAELANERLDSPSPSSYNHILLDAPIIVRNSSGAANRCPTLKAV
jgi:LacI family transcriptional regulator